MLREAPIQYTSEGIEYGLKVVWDWDENKFDNTNTFFDVVAAAILGNDEVNGVVNGVVKSSHHEGGDLQVEKEKKEDRSNSLTTESHSQVELQMETRKTINTEVSIMENQETSTLDNSDNSNTLGVPLDTVGEESEESADREPNLIVTVETQISESTDEELESELQPLRPQNPEQPLVTETPLPPQKEQRPPSPSTIIDPCSPVYLPLTIPTHPNTNNPKLHYVELRLFYAYYEYALHLYQKSETDAAMHWACKAEEFKYHLRFVHYLK
jgi:hypothetical protein